MGFSGSSEGKKSAVHETQVWAVGWEDPLEKAVATHSSILSWSSPWLEESFGL